GVRTIHFCGGEPTIHPAMAALVGHVESRGAKSRLTTNGIVMPEELLRAMRQARTGVKVSLHGDREHHNRMVGRPGFDQATATIERLIGARVPVSVQTTVVAGGEWVVDWMAVFCRAAGVRRLSILPFIPRGSGGA